MTTKTIDITPKWMGIYPALKEMIFNGTKEQKEYVCSELERLCLAADKLRAAAQKAGDHSGKD